MAGTRQAVRGDVPDGWAADRPSARSLVVFAVVLAYVGACVVYGLYLARQALLLVYLSALIAIGLAPFMRLLERRGVLWRPRPMSRTAAVVLVYLVVLALGAAALLMIVPTLLGQAQAFAASVPDLLHRSQSWLVERGVLPRELSMQEVVRRAPVGADAVGTIVSTLWGVVGGIFGVATILVLSFYLLVETDALFRTFIRLVPRPRRQHVREIAAQITEKVSAWLGGQVLVAAIIGSTAAVGLALLGVPYFYVLALIAAVGELIPYLGPLLAAIPAVAVASSVSWQLAIAVVVFYFVQQQFENYLVVPRLMSSQVGLSPVAVIVALLVGASLYGVLGAILAIPTAAILQVLVHELVPAEP
jgi:predicted PurR-regulated permease PerM